MADNHEERVAKRALAATYTAKIRKREARLNGLLTKDQLEFLRGHELLPHNRICQDLQAAMSNSQVIPSRYIDTHMGWLFGDVIPESDKASILYFADKLREYPYSESYVRRSFRCKSNGSYAQKLAQILRAYGTPYTNMIDAPVDKILNREISQEMQAYLEEFHWYGCGYNCWQVAYALDHRDSRIEEAVQRILTEENGSGMMTAALIRGVLISHRNEFHELLGKLLLAAKLQEGLRQAICESADYGTKEGFLTIIKVIADNNLIRFSSVKRAVGTWLGIQTDNARDLERINQKSVQLIVECVENESMREEYLASEDAMKIYIALWSYGLDDVLVSADKIQQISKEGTHHQRLVAGYFAANLDLPYLTHWCAKAVLAEHHNQEDVLAMWLPCFLPNTRYVLWQMGQKGQEFNFNGWFDSHQELCKYYDLMKSWYEALVGKTKIFSPCVFPWHEAKLSKSDLAEMVCALAALSGENEKIDEACALIKECSADNRNSYFTALLRKPQTVLQRKTVLDGLADRESLTRKSAYDITGNMKLTADEYRLIEDHLRFKSADIRQNVMKILQRQGDADLTVCIGRLLSGNKEDVRLGGLDILMQMKKNSKRCAIADSFTTTLSAKAQAENLSSKEKVLLESLLPNLQEATADENPLFTVNDKYLPTEFDEDYIELCAKTFAECFPDSKLPDLIRGKKDGTNLWDKIKSTVTGNAPCKSAQVAEADLISLSKLIHEHKNDSFVNSSGETILLGNNPNIYHFKDQDGKLPLSHLWQEWIQTNGITNGRIVRAYVYYLAYTQITPFSEEYADYIKAVYGAGFEYRKDLPNSVIGLVLRYLFDALPAEDVNRLVYALAIWYVRCVPDDKVIYENPDNNRLPRYMQIEHMLSHRQLMLLYGKLVPKNDENLKYIFPLMVACSEKSVRALQQMKRDRGKESLDSEEKNRVFAHIEANVRPSGMSPIGASAYIYAAYQGIITEPQLYEFLLNPDNLCVTLDTVTAIAASHYEKGKQISNHNPYKDSRDLRKVKAFLGKDEPDEQDLKLIDFVAHIYETIIPVVISSELRRGDSPAKYSNGICNIARIYGTKYFAEILSALGKDTLDRSAYYGWGTLNDRKRSLSYLLSVCIPTDNDTVDTLQTALKDRKITKARLIEAALFSPEWIPLVGQYLKIESFESVCYYFMAHMNEKFDDKRKAMIAKFTPLTEEELNLGAFDVNWFRSAYETIGEEEFELIYDAAKYITDGAKHSRARKYADATLGKFDVDETEKTVSDKRNKDLLMAYALIPLKDEDDLCRRYLYIQQFRKESKQFGSQRIASEAKAVEMALTNLAINAGYSDTMRLTLRMESKVIDDSRALLEEQIIDGVSVKIHLDENGKASLICVKDGKQLKSVPAKLKKHETVLALTELVKTLTEQYRRTRVMLERAMEDSTRFTFGELSALSAHPVVYPMLKNLVLISDGAVGFLTKQGLADDKGAIQFLNADATLKIAHPFDLYSKGCWRNYQHYLFENKIAQPFRQVFRELYVKTAEEKGMFHSLRYAGNQIQPAKTVGALKSRRWVADVENGLQKVYYKENIVAQIYALADWFSPADIEAPTLEWVCFTDRKTGKELKIADIPDIVFSEVMRDVDLAVSVAHAGGVDPETSHSTMEMRGAILSFVLPMFRIGNVKIEGHHAIIEGKLAEYSVHLGSGVVHQLGGAMIPVLPVHSQHRGKIFLPFVDDDPKTAEIISKVLLFAEDDKIKDPMILAEIRK